MLDRRWRQSIADIVRHGRETGEFPEGDDADELGIAIGAMIDGLAIPVLMNDPTFTPQRMQRGLHGRGRETDRLLADRRVAPALAPFARGRLAHRDTDPAHPGCRHRRRRCDGVAPRGRLARGRTDRGHLPDGQRHGGAGDREHPRGAGTGGAPDVEVAHAARRARSCATTSPFPRCTAIEASATRCWRRPRRRRRTARRQRLLVETARERPGEVLLVATGPLTNVAVGVAEEPRAPRTAEGVRHHGGLVRAGRQRLPRRRGEHLGRSRGGPGRVPRVRRVCRSAQLPRLRGPRRHPTGPHDSRARRVGRARRHRTRRSLGS